MIWILLLLLQKGFGLISESNMFPEIYLFDDQKSWKSSDC